MMRRNIVRNSSGNGLASPEQASRLDDCNEFFCPDVKAAIVVPTLLLISAIIILGIVYFKRKYNLLDNNSLPKVSFNMPNIIKMTK